jgi:hypothetical protein
MGSSANRWLRRQFHCKCERVFNAEIRGRTAREVVSNHKNHKVGQNRTSNKTGDMSQHTFILLASPTGFEPVLPP